MRTAGGRTRCRAVRLNHQRVRLSDRLHSAGDGDLQVAKRIALGEMDDRPDEGKQIPRSMIDFAQEQHDMLFPLLLLGNVSRDLGSTDDFAAGVPHRRNRDQHRKQAAVFAPTDRLIVGDALDAADPSDDLALFVMPIER